ncbi:spore coat protein [Neobacillus sp. PS3-12]|uniref:spore coat protein n=1 Tax=Neobacillus sp. PS3-12 TaxID=3070677 RepID=UPI0027DF994B|nr:spore coat protein [Neobacillus sp. PS3-12]WML53022.1 spore coat protein [Neobacillus sp. PS3-12]
MSKMESPNLDSYHSFLQSLIGEEVQVYRGGPESKTGKLLDVQSDFITVYAQNNNNKNGNNNQKNNQSQDNNQIQDNNQSQDNNQNTVVYYRTQHLQSISENTKSNSYPRYQNQEEEQEFPFKTGADFSELVWNLKGTYVQINQGGPESKNGMLLDVSDNYVALLTEDDGVVYYNIQHMKSISEYNQNNNESQNQEEQEVSIPEYIVTDNFHDIFGEMSHKWVSINRGGPEALEGILVQSAGGHYTLINNDEVLRINPYHIKSISCGPKGVMKNENNNDDSEENSGNEEYSTKSNSNSQESGNSLSSSSSRQSSSSRRRSSSRSSRRSSSRSSRRSSSRSSRRRSSGSRRRRSSGSRRRRSSGSRRRRSSGSRRRRSSSSRQRGNNSNETIVKTMDYVWMPNR